MRASRRSVSRPTPRALQRPHDSLLRDGSGAARRATTLAVSQRGWPAAGRAAGRASASSQLRLRALGASGRAAGPGSCSLETCCSGLGRRRGRHAAHRRSAGLRQLLVHSAAPGRRAPQPRSPRRHLCRRRGYRATLSSALRCRPDASLARGALLPGLAHCRSRVRREPRTKPPPPARSSPCR